MGATQWGGAYVLYKHFVERRTKLPFAWQNVKKHAFRVLFFLAETVGFESTCRLITDKTISSFIAVC